MANENNAGRNDGKSSQDSPGFKPKTQSPEEQRHGADRSRDSDMSESGNQRQKGQGQAGRDSSQRDSSRPIGEDQDDASGAV